MWGPRFRCSLCGEDLASAVEVRVCNECGAPVHVACRERTDLCGKCGAWIAAEPYFLPATPVLDVVVVVMVLLSAVLWLLAVVLLLQVDYGPAAAGTNGLVFYFIALPVTLLAFASTAVLALALFSRRTARKPRPAGR